MKQVRVVKIRVFGYNDPTLFNGYLVENSIPRCVLVWKVQCVNGVVTSIGKNLPQTRRQMRIQEKPHVASICHPFAFSD